MHTLPPLAVEGISKRYRTQTVLEAVGFELAPAEIFGLIGLNGAGKTTLIKIILDLAKADSGAARLFGEPSTRPASRRHLSYLPEKFQPSRYLNGMEFLHFTLSHYQRPLNRETARAKIQALDLDVSALDKRVSTYSKGMGQKLGLAGAFLAEAPLIILDEPMSGLDPRARIRLKEELLRQRSAGRTVFFSSHILSDIDEICDRIGILHSGRLLFVGTPAVFKAQYGAGISLEQTFLKAIEEKKAA